MEHRRRDSPERTAEVELAPPTVDYAELLEQALTMPGHLGAQYSRFHDYSLNNQILLFMQGCTGPVATYNRWKELRRQVKRGSKAKSILRPILYKQKNEAGEEESRLGGFKMVRCIFELNDTEGEDLPPVEVRQWSPQRALEQLGITEIPFEAPTGNTMGYSVGEQLAVSPLAPYPLKTLVHEMTHIAHGHTRSGDQDARQHRGVREFQAEATAYLVLHALSADQHMNAAESRGYIQYWLKGERPSDEAIRSVFSVTDKIRRAGLVDRVSGAEPVREETARVMGAAALEGGQ